MEILNRDEIWESKDGPGKKKCRLAEIRRRQKGCHGQSPIWILMTSPGICAATAPERIPYFWGENSLLDESEDDKTAGQQMGG